MLPEDNLSFGSYTFRRRLFPSTYLSGDFVEYFPIDEQHPTFTTDSYSFSKQVMEEIGAYFWRREGISSVLLRLPGVYEIRAERLDRWRVGRAGVYVRSPAPGPRHRTAAMSGKLEDAAARYEAAWALEPYDFAALVRLAEVYLELGRYEDAETTFNAALALNRFEQDGGNSVEILSKEVAREEPNSEAGQILALINQRAGVAIEAGALRGKAMMAIDACGADLLVVAIDGGTPIRKTQLNYPFYGPQFYDDVEKQELLEVLASKQPFRGRKVDSKALQFEKAYAAHIGVKYALGVTSGTTALYTAMAALGISPRSASIRIRCRRGKRSSRDSLFWSWVI